MTLVSNTTFKIGSYYLSYTYNNQNGYKEVNLFKFDGIFSNNILCKVALSNKLPLNTHTKNKTLFFELTSDEIYHNITLEKLIESI
jgi:hypothetical protein